MRKCLLFYPPVELQPLVESMPGNNETVVAARDGLATYKDFPSSPVLNHLCSFNHGIPQNNSRGTPLLVHTVLLGNMGQMGVFM